MPGNITRPLDVVALQKSQDEKRGELENELLTKKKDLEAYQVVKGNCEKNVRDATSALDQAQASKRKLEEEKNTAVKLKEKLDIDSLLEKNKKLIYEVFIIKASEFSKEISSAAKKLVEKVVKEKLEIKFVMDQIAALEKMKERAKIVPAEGGELKSLTHYSEAIKDLKAIAKEIEGNQKQLKDHENLPAEINALEGQIEAESLIVTPLEEKLNGLQNELVKHEKILADKVKVVEELQRSLFVNKLKDSLDSYLARRSLTFGIKDSFSPKDLKDRTSFIEDLKKELGNYDKSGDVKQMGDMRTLIKDNLVRFPGVHLSSILNQMTVDLYEEEESLRSSSIADDTVQARTDQPDLSETDQPDLSEREKQVEREKQAVANLRASIQKMKDYGEQIGGQFKKDCYSLAEALHKDMGDFIRTDRTQKTYDQFSDKFKARLHSKNDLMAKHPEPWKVIVTNVFLALTGVGVLVIAGKLIHSKATTGRATFFGEETPGQHKVSDIKKALSEIKPSAPPPDNDSGSAPTT